MKPTPSSPPCGTLQTAPERALLPVPFFGYLQRQFAGRALAVHRDLWAEYPACYLTDEEIS